VKRLPAHMEMSIDHSRVVIPAFELISKHLDQVRELMSQQFTAPGSAEEVEQLLRHIDAKNGKMIRPALVLLSGACCGPITEQHITVAAVVEIIHTATLLHDDVIDQGQTRRGRPTVNSLWGNESAVLLGDFLLSRVFKMCAELPYEATREIGTAAVRVCEGELRQVAQKKNLKLSEPEYIDIIANKSASLFSSCCRIGAALTRTDQAQALSEFGLNTGIAFQITDDLLDVVGDENRTGKTLGSDISNSKLTLPLIHLLRTIEKDRKGEIEDMLMGGIESRRELGELLRRHGSLEYARNRSQEFIDKAISSLDNIDPSEARTSLEQIAQFAGDRAA